MYIYILLFHSYLLERLLAEQTVLDTKTIATLIGNAINRVKPLSTRKYLHASYT